MKTEAIRDRREAYTFILTQGLIAIRDFGSCGRDPELCRIEADHLHNIPSLMDEMNEHRHIYYAVKERTLYLERVQALADKDYLHVTVELYKRPWILLMKLALGAQEQINMELEQHLGTLPRAPAGHSEVQG